MLKPFFYQSHLSLNHLLAHLRMPLYRNGYALLLSGVASAGLGMVYWFLATQHYDAATVGLNSAAISALMLVSGLAQLSLNSVLIRFLPGAGAATGRLIGSAYLISIATSILGGLIFGLGIDFWAPSLRPFLATPPLLVAFVASVAIWSLFALQDSVLTGLRQTIWVPLENISVAGLKLGLLLVFAQFMHSYGIFAAWVLPALVALVPINLLIYRQVQSQPHALNSRDTLELGVIGRFALANFVGTLCFLAYTTLLPLVVVNQAGLRANAYFYMPWMIATGLQLIASNMITALTVEAVHDTQRLRLYCQRALRQSLRLLVPLVSLIIGVAPLIMGVFGSDYAAGGTTLLRLLVLATLPNVFVQLYIGLMRVRKSARVIIAQAAQGVLLLTLSFGLLPLYGITGVGWAALLSQSAVAAFVFVTELRAFLKQEAVA